MMVVLFKELKEKQFIVCYSTCLEGQWRVIKHHGTVARPKGAEFYLKVAVAEGHSR